MTRIRLAGVEFQLDQDRSWSVVQAGVVRSASFLRSLERSLTLNYGPEWEPAFGVYEPSHRNASAREIATDLGAEILELDPITDGPDGRVY